jgi:hypothetical protein
MSGALFGVALALAALWALRALALWDTARALPPLPPLGPGDVAAPRPRVSVVLAARDEAARIETTVRRLLEQRDVDLEVVAVDDRSTDGTGATLDRLAAESPAVRAEHVTELPPGWLGKCHALDRGTRLATGDWLLFTDADAWLAPDVVARALAAAARERADHVAILPGQRHLRSPLGTAVLITMSTGLAPFAAKANRDRGFVGIGAFNLVRRDAWEAVGGHEALRLEVVDDLYLGYLLAAAGKRTRAFPSGHDVDVDFATSPRALMRVLEKNAFAVYDYRAVLTFAWMGFLAAVILATLALPFVGTWWGLLPLAALLLQAVPAARLARSGGMPGWPALLLPFGLLVMVATVTRSAVLAVARGGIRWRDTFYDLATLRKARRDLKARAARLREETRAAR